MVNSPTSKASNVIRHCTMIITDKRFDDLKSKYLSCVPALSTIHSEFGGPSIYFHQQALIECNNNFLSDRHLEMIYATLSSWGMHRMGKTQTKMVDFDVFKKSTERFKNDLIDLRLLALENFNSEPTELLNRIQEICFGLNVSVSKSKIVGNSKALAHILPNLVPPVDRQYTIRFFAEKLSDFKGIAEEQKFYIHILKKCYEFAHLLIKDPAIKIDKQFNSSLPKIFDNLVMVYLKSSTTAYNIGFAQVGADE